MKRIRLIAVLGVMALLLGTVSPIHAQGTPRNPQQIEEARANNPKQIMNWVLVLATGLIGVLTLGLFLAFFPKGYRDAKEQDTTKIPAPAPAPPSSPEIIPEPRVVFLDDDPPAPS